MWKLVAADSVARQMELLLSLKWPRSGFRGVTYVKTILKKLNKTTNLMEIKGDGILQEMYEEDLVK